MGWVSFSLFSSVDSIYMTAVGIITDFLFVGLLRAIITTTCVPFREKTQPDIQDNRPRFAFVVVVAVQYVDNHGLEQFVNILEVAIVVPASRVVSYLLLAQRYRRRASLVINCFLDYFLADDLMPLHVPDIDDENKQRLPPIIMLWSI